MKTGIIFDMDGTLWDSTEQIAQAWSAISVPKLGKEVTREELYRVMGMPMDKLARELFPQHDLDEVLSIAEECYEAENEYLCRHGANLYPRVIETIGILARQFPLYIVSNCQCGYIEVFLEYYHLETYFKDHACFGDNGRQKSENIALIIERNQLERGIYVGDIQADYEAALAGGAEFIHAAYGFGNIQAQVPKVDAFFELPGLLQQMCAGAPKKANP